MYNQHENDDALPGLPLAVELIMDAQVNKSPDDASDHYSHTGNSWN